MSKANGEKLGHPLNRDNLCYKGPSLCPHHPVPPTFALLYCVYVAGLETGSRHSFAKVDNKACTSSSILQCDMAVVILFNHTGTDETTVYHQEVLSVMKALKEHFNKVGSTS